MSKKVERRLAADEKKSLTNPESLDADHCRIYSWRKKIRGKTNRCQTRQKTVETHHARRRQAEEHPHGRVPVGREAGTADPDSRGLRAAQPRPRPAARLARQGRAGLERSGRPCPAALHPGEGPSQGLDRRSAPADGRQEAADKPPASVAARPVRRLQRHPRGRRTRPSSTSTTRTGPTA